jgi:hypothetical protein
LAWGYAELCGFSGGTLDRTAFSKFIAEPQTVEGVFSELRSQALKMELYGRGNVDGTFIHALGWRARTVATEARLLLAYTVRRLGAGEALPREDDGGTSLQTAAQSSWQ